METNYSTLSLRMINFLSAFEGKRVTILTYRFELSLGACLHTINILYPLWSSVDTLFRFIYLRYRRRMDTARRVALSINNVGSTLNRVNLRVLVHENNDKNDKIQLRKNITIKHFYKIFLG